jgi:hypothetical protein|tara:strand:- start:99 stop:335 length:237 start_codon:yes stop_codon:yes gene_type:complete
MSQKLSPQARAKKAKRDKQYAMTPGRRAKKAENQRLRRKYLKKGFSLAGLDYDHEDNKFESIKNNRGNDGNGTKTEKT